MREKRDIAHGLALSARQRGAATAEGGGGAEDDAGGGSGDCIVLMLVCAGQRWRCRDAREKV
jgi:hypothetical protein